MRDTEAGDIIPPWVSKPSDWESVSGRESHTCSVSEYLPACSDINVQFFHSAWTHFLVALPLYVCVDVSIIYDPP
jgi:hypothetical protein